DFGGAETDFPKRRRATQRNIVVPWDFKETPPPDLPLGILKMSLHDFCKAELLFSANDHSIIQADGRYRRVKPSGGGLKNLLSGISSRFLYGLSHNRSRAARIGAFIEGRVMRIQRGHANAFGRHRQLFGDNLQESRAHALADFHRARRK